LLFFKTIKKKLIIIKLQSS